MKATVFHVRVGAITPCRQCRACLSGALSQCGHGERRDSVLEVAIRREG